MQEFSFKERLCYLITPFLTQKVHKRRTLAGAGLENTVHRGTEIDQWDEEGKGWLG